MNIRKALIVIALATLLASTQSYASAGPGVYYANSEVNVAPVSRFGSYSYPWGINSTYYSYGRNRIFLSRRPVSINRNRVYLDSNGLLPDWQYGSTPRYLTAAAPSKVRGKSVAPPPPQRLHSTSQTGRFGSTVKRPMKQARFSKKYGRGGMGRSKSSRGGRSYGGVSSHKGGHSPKGSHTSVK